MKAVAVEYPAHRTSFALTLGFALIILLAMPAAAHAMMLSGMGNILCNLIGVIYGNFGRALATLAVISLGVGAMIGKVSWGLAITVAVGIGVVFGAATITRGVLMAASGVSTIGCTINNGGNMVSI